MSLKIIYGYSRDIITDIFDNETNAELGITLGYLIGAIIYTHLNPGLENLLWLAVPVYTAFDASERLDGKGISEKIAKTIL